MQLPAPGQLQGWDMLAHQHEATALQAASPSAGFVAAPSTTAMLRQALPSLVIRRMLLPPDPAIRPYVVPLDNATTMKRGSVNSSHFLPSYHHLTFASFGPIPAGPIRSSIRSTRGVCQDQTANARHLSARHQ